MKNYAKLVLIPATLALLPLQAMSANSEAVSFEKELSSEQKQMLAKEAKGKMKLFAGDLKKTLKRGMKSKGPIEAINLCNIQAPQIASKHSAGGTNESDWTISRTSLKVRNPNNTATDWQADILLDFEKRKTAGEPAKKIATSLVRDGSFYFVKAIPTAPLCTTCHGNNIAPVVQNRLKELYPDDKAIGFKAGDIRGAFIVSRKLGD